MTRPLPKDALAALSRGHTLTKDQQAAIRAEWYARLEREGHRQCAGLTRDYAINSELGNPRWGAEIKVCALALLGEITEGETWWRVLRTPEEANSCLITIAGKAGLSTDQVNKIVHMNDGDFASAHSRKHALRPPRTFRKISETIRGWFNE